MIFKCPEFQWETADECKGCKYGPWIDPECYWKNDYKHLYKILMILNSRKLTRGYKFLKLRCDKYVYDETLTFKEVT